MAKVVVTLVLDVADTEFVFCPSMPDKCRGCEVNTTALKIAFDEMIVSFEREHDIAVTSIQVKD